MTEDVYRKWFLSCFLHEVNDLRDNHIRIQFILDNSTGHKIELESMDPDVSLKFLPPYTKSVIQPMDQGSLCSVKTRAKKAFYKKMFKYCQQHPNEYTALDDF